MQGDELVRDGHEPKNSKTLFSVRQGDLMVSNPDNVFATADIGGGMIFSGFGDERRLADM